MSGSEAVQESIHAKKKDFVRHELWTAAMDLFYSTGFDETTIEQVAAKANVSRRTFFRYFSSKEDVMAAMMKGYGAALVQALRDQPKDLPSVDAARAVVRRVARLAADSSHASQILTIVTRSPAARSAQLLQLPVIEDELTQVFADREKGKHKFDLKHRLLASLTLSVTTLSIYRWLEHPERSIEGVVDDAFASLTELFCGKQKH